MRPPARWQRRSSGTGAGPASSRRWCRGGWSSDDDACSLCFFPKGALGPSLCVSLSLSVSLPLAQVLSLRGLPVRSPPSGLRAWGCPTAPAVCARPAGPPSWPASLAAGGSSGLRRSPRTSGAIMRGSIAMRGLLPHRDGMTPAWTCATTPLAKRSLVPLAHRASSSLNTPRGMRL
jgi:hypothetical protein